MSGHDSGKGLDHEFGHAETELEFDLLAYARVLLKYRRMILISVFSAAVVAAAVSLLMHNVYRAEILLAPAQSKDGKGGGIAAALGGMGSLGGLASMAGISLGGGSNEEYLAVMKSREFLWKFVQEKKLLPILFADKWDEAEKRWNSSDPKEQPGQLDVVRLFNDGGVLHIATDKKTDLTTVAIEWRDPSLAATWANDLVASLNLYLGQTAIERSERNLKYLNTELERTQIEELRRSLFDLISQEQKNAMLAHAQKEFAFRVLDSAVVPDRKVKPKRSVIVLLAALAAAVLASIAAFMRENLVRSRQSSVGEHPAPRSINQL